MGTLSRLTTGRHPVGSRLSRRVLTARRVLVAAAVAAQQLGGVRIGQLQLDERYHRVADA
ncbi:hypothetical protein [Micromonospora echinofusca]|uniref:hypothetical protein n=1 Tax=Micromonospora echinofusca TaxID=47858 RepID=UPI0033C3299B